MPEYIFAPKSHNVRVVLHQTMVLLNALRFLSAFDHYPNLSHWIPETAAKIGAERLYHNTLIAEGLSSALHCETSPDDFETYLAWLEDQEAETLRDSAYHGVLTHFQKYQIVLDKYPTLEAAIVAYYTAMNGNKKELRRFAADLQHLFEDANALKHLMLSHLRWMWEHILAPEWERTSAFLQECVDAYQKFDYGGMTPNDVLRAISGRDLHGAWDKMLENCETLLFIPSPHLGPYVAAFHEGSEARILFGARIPAKVSLLNRSEILVRLNALADDNRLRILELLGSGEEISAQTIINQLGITQSAASRHLRQLSATGYIIERTWHGAKHYRLNIEQINNTFEGLRQFIHRVSAG